MQEITKDQHFFILEDIDLFPEIKTNGIAMVEQIMNAIIILNKNNIQLGIKRALDIEYICRPFLSDNYLTLLNRIIPLLKQHRISIVQGEQIRFMYPSYHDPKNFYWDIGKQTLINNEFALLKKLSYDGANIKFEDTYVNWVDSIILEREAKTQHNSEDQLVFNVLEPKTLEHRIEIKDIILLETQKYTEQYRKELQANSLQSNNHQPNVH